MTNAFAPLPNSPDEIPPAPRQPSRRARSLVFSYQISQKVLLIAGLFFFGMGALFSTLLTWGLATDFLIDLSSTSVDGQVVRSEVFESTKVNGKHPVDITVTYRMGDRDLQTVVNSYGSAVAESAVPGATLRLQVAILSPTVARLFPGPRAPFGYLGLFSLLLPGFGLLLMFFAIRTQRRRVRAYYKGQPALAKVVFRGHDASVSVNGRHPFMLTWEFIVNGGVYTGSLSSMKLLELDDLMKRPELVVLYDPANPSINTVYLE